ncbi:MAG: T9SS type A sorting domain-containing protein, partial [Bacteroidia bacterium]|nr:T9SS type A sorting domain-containing protein [Bacteroidia bacterium]
IASQHTVYTGTGDLADMQRAKNGKIYIVEAFASALNVIDAPDMAGSACNYVQGGQSIAPKSTLWSLPEFVSSSVAPIVPVTYTVSCGNASFTSYHPSQNVFCQSSSYSLTNVLWLFGDAAASGSLNASTALNPVHHFSSNGTYSVQMISYYTCGGGTDTLKLNVTITDIPPLTVLGNTNICIGENRTYTASGADSYSWSSGATTQSVLLNPTVNSVYTVSGTSTLTGCSTSKTLTINVAECTSVEKTNKVNSLKIYPNPFNSNLTLETENSVLLQFINQLGETVIECSFDPGKHSVDLSNFNAGIYTLKYTDKTGTRGRLLVKFD